MKILVAEDERDLNDVIKRYLEKYQHVVDQAYTGTEAEDFLAFADYDLLILDIMMPGKNGFDVLKEMRERGDETPVLCLTAKGELEDKLTGLNLGGDDYLVKPFDFEELLARIHSVTRRYQGRAGNELTASNLTIDVEAQQAYLSGQVLNLTAKEYQLLEYLVRNKNQIISADQMLENLWDKEAEVESNVIQVLIKNIRKKVDRNRKHSLITTKRNLGYVIYDEK